MNFDSTGVKVADVEKQVKSHDYILLFQRNYGIIILYILSKYPLESGVDSE